MSRVYLDNQATTQIDPEVLKEMMPYLTDKYGNASSRNHPQGWEADEAVHIARERVAESICANPKEIIFTSGATEAINLALKGWFKKNKAKNHLITLKTEHKATLDNCSILEKKGVNVTYLPVQENGIVDLKVLENSITPDTALISILHANNEIGVIQPIEAIGKLCKKNNIIFHVDGAQSLGKLPIDVLKMGIDLLSISAHKLYGPKGIGALFVRRRNPRVDLHAIIDGGGHENGLRSGTLPVHQIVGFGKACVLAITNMVPEQARIGELRKQLASAIQSGLPNTIINGDLDNRLAGNLNMSFTNINSEALIMAMPEISVSTGSACTSSTMDPSHVLLALGRSKELAYGSIRIGIGRFTSQDDIEIASRSIVNGVKKLQSIRL